MSRGIVSRTFCCCIPVRVGVVLLSLLGLLGGAGIATLEIIKLKRGETSHKVVTIISIVVYAVLALVSIFGLIGAFARKLAFIRAYLGMLIVHLLASVGVGAWAIWRTFKESPQYVTDCISDSTDEAVAHSCHAGATVVKAVTIGIFVVAWILEIWGCVIVGDYSKQLAEEDATQKIKDTESW